MKILVIRFSSIGDIVLTTPVVRVLKTQLENVQVHYATKMQFKSIFDENPYIDRVHYLGKDLASFIRELRKEKFDFIVDLHNNLRTRIIKTALLTKATGFDKLNVHIVDRYLKALDILGVKNDSLGLDYFIPEKDVVPIDWIPKTHHNGYVAFAIGAQHATKRLPVERMIELCDKINRPIVLLGGKEDAVVGEQVCAFFEKTTGSSDYEDGLKELNKKSIIYNACGKYNLNQSASLVKQAKYVFTHDTGLMHIAAAFKKEIFSIWGNTIPEFGMYPYRTKFTVLENNKLNCRPCSKIGHNACPKKHFKCMNEMVFDFYLPG
jgi:ADP-heptose:LPS heptosyltransferase